MIVLYTIIFFALGILAVVLFHISVFLPICASIVVYLGISFFLLQRFRQKRVGVLILILWLVYILPFIHIVPYMWFNFDSESPSKLWGLVINPYMLDEQTIMLTAMIGAVSGLGFALGVSFSNKKIVRDAGYASDKYTKQTSVLPSPIWVVWVSVAVILSWLAAPRDTIFLANYASSISLLNSANFDSAWLVSYVLLIYSFCDTIVDQNNARRKFKLIVIVFTAIFIFIYLQLLRGDREAVPLVFAMLMLYFYWAAPWLQKKQAKPPWGKLGLGALFLVVISMIFGVIRFSFEGTKDITGVFDLFMSLVDSGAIGVSNLLEGTWSAVLLTPLSVAGDYINELLPLKLGEDYLNLLLSIPPGFLTDVIGYSRPIDSLHGPAWEMRYGLGGTHASVLPFVNFRMIGVFIIPAFWAYLLTCYEKTAMTKLSVINLSMLGTVATVAPHWLWYGEKNGSNALILWGVLGFIYRISIRNWQKSDL